MGTRGNRANRGCKKVAERWTERMIQNILEQQYLSNPHFVVKNLYVFSWESDFLAKTKAGYWYEVEIKISVADFKNDAKNKAEKFKILAAHTDGEEKILRPNYFSYCVPEEIVDKVKDLVPPYAGLYSITGGKFLHCHKLPEQLHSIKLSDLELNLVDKFYYNYSDYRRKYERVDTTIRDLRAEIRWLKDEFEAATGSSISDIL